MLDEPTIGLHPRDNRVLLGALKNLSDKGNTLVVVEHDEDTIRAADHIIDIGPGAGKRGGRWWPKAARTELSAQPDSVTGRFLAQPLVHPLGARREVRPRQPAWSRRVAARATDRRHAGRLAGDCSGASLHNLRGLDVACRCGAWWRSPASAARASRRWRATCC